MDLIHSFRGEDIGHMAGTRPSTSWALLTCGHFLGPPFRNPQVFSKYVSMTVAGYSKGPSMLSGVRSSYGSLSPSASPIAAQGRNRGNSNLCITPHGTTLALEKGMEVSLSVWIEWRLKQPFQRVSRHQGMVPPCHPSISETKYPDCGLKVAGPGT